MKYQLLNDIEIVLTPNCILELKKNDIVDFVGASPLSFNDVWVIPERFNKLGLEIQVCLNLDNLRLYLENAYNWSSDMPTGIG